MQEDETAEKDIELKVERMPIDIILAEPIFIHGTLKKSIGYIMHDLSLDYKLHLRNDGTTSEYYIKEAPENAIVYAHSSHSNQNAFFSMALDVSPQRPDLRFILRIRDSHSQSDFKDIKAFSTYNGLVQHEPHPSKPISISNEEAGIFTSWMEEGEESFKYYMVELKQLRGIK